MTSKVARNASWIIGCKLVQSILGFVLNMLTARFLGKSSFGSITYAMAVVSFVVPLMRLGFGNIMVQAKAAGEVRDLWEMRKVISDSIELKHFSPRDKALWDAAYDRFLAVVKRKG